MDPSADVCKQTKKPCTYSGTCKSSLKANTYILSLTLADHIKVDSKKSKSFKTTTETLVLDPIDGSHVSGNYGIDDMVIFDIPCTRNNIWRYCDNNLDMVKKSNNSLDI